jgi:hypothetical protein
MKYTKNSPRLTVKFINADTEDVLFEVRDRSWMNVGELLSDFYVDNLMKTELKGKKLPKNLLVLVVSEFNLE